MFCQKLTAHQGGGGGGGGGAEPAHHSVIFIPSGDGGVMCRGVFAQQPGGGALRVSAARSQVRASKTDDVSAAMFRRL